MRLGTVLIAAYMILVLFGVADVPLERLKLKKRGVVYLLFVMLVAGAYTVRVVQEFSFRTDVLLFLVVLGILAARKKQGILLGLLLAFPVGTMVYLLQKVTGGAEPGLIYGLAAGSLCSLLIVRPWGALFAAALSPLIAQACLVAEELVNFGYTVVELGAGIYFDTMIVGTAFVFLIYSLRSAFQRYLARPDRSGIRSSS